MMHHHPLTFTFLVIKVHKISMKNLRKLKKETKEKFKASKGGWLWTKTKIFRLYDETEQLLELLDKAIEVVTLRNEESDDDYFYYMDFNQVSDRHVLSLPPVPSPSQLYPTCRTTPRS